MADRLAVRESQVEDALAALPLLLQEVLGLAQPPQLVARQMILPSGRLDMLLATGRNLTLIELKVEPARKEFVEQVIRYLQDLRDLQAAEDLVSAEIAPVLMCPSFSKTMEAQCHSANVRPVQYSPEDVLARFFRSLRPLAELIALRPTDLGLWNIHLIHRVLHALESGTNAIPSIAKLVGLSRSSVANHLRLAEELRLAEGTNKRYQLTALGADYVAARSDTLSESHVSEAQAVVLRDFIVKDPFASATVFGIFSIVEAVFSLARNVYPVSRELLIPYFRQAAGKLNQWNSQTTAYHGTRMYSNYAIDLGLLARSGDSFFLTPDGIRFILLLQLHKSIRLIDAVGITAGES